MHELWLYQLARLAVGREGGIGTYQIRVSPQASVSAQLDCLTDRFTYASVTHRYENGINTFDTADVYSNGESERILGKALKEYNISRESVVITTKVGLFLEAGRFARLLTRVHIGILRGPGRRCPASSGRSG